MSLMMVIVFAVSFAAGVFVGVSRCEAENENKRDLQRKYDDMCERNRRAVKEQERWQHEYWRLKGYVRKMAEDLDRRGVRVKWNKEHGYYIVPEEKKQGQPPAPPSGKPYSFVEVQHAEDNPKGR